MTIETTESNVLQSGCPFAGVIPYLIKNWPELQLHLIGVAVGIVVELVLIYLIIGSLLSRREEKRWRPARRIIILQLAKAHSALFNASNQIVRRIFESDNYPAYQGAQLFLRQLEERLGRLRMLVDINNVALDSTLMPKIAVFLEQTEEAHKKLRLFAELHNPQTPARDIVGEPPLKELTEVARVVDYLKSIYADVFSDPSLSNPPLLGISELSDLWSKAARGCDRLCLDPTAYRFRPGRTPFVYDLNQLRKLPRPEAHDAQVHVLDIYGI